MSSHAACAGATEFNQNAEERNYLGDTVAMIMIWQESTWNRLFFKKNLKVFSDKKND